MNDLLTLVILTSNIIVLRINFNRFVKIQHLQYPVLLDMTEEFDA